MNATVRAFRIALSVAALLVAVASHDEFAHIGANVPPYFPEP